MHQKFVEVAEAYEALIEPETRKIYDQYGHEGLQQHKQGGNRQQQNPFDLFSRFFGGGGHFGHGQRRGQDMQVRVEVPLRDFYNGAEHEITIEKQAICGTCAGSGSEDGKTEHCARCNGQGVVIQKAQLAPGIFQQVQMHCDACGGKGTTIKHKCKTCGGQRVVREQETYTLHVEKGMPDGAHEKFDNEADESPDYVAGDLYVHIHQKTPALAPAGAEPLDRTDGTFFRRKGNDLFWREALSLREAWLGDWSRNLTHLDGHTVRLGRARGEVVQPGAVEVVEGEGMPVWRHEHGPDHGNLLVEYVVVLPDQMDKGMEKDFWAVWEKWRKTRVEDLGRESGRPPAHDEL